MGTQVFYNNYYSGMPSVHKVPRRYANSLQFKRSPINYQVGGSLRPNHLDLGWTIGSRSNASSGYCSAENSTESEYPPFDWEAVRIRLNELKPVDVEVDTSSGGVATMSKEYFFTILFQTTTSTPAYEAFGDKVEIRVVGPEPTRHPYPVRMTPGRKINEIKCSIMPFEVGTFCVMVRTSDVRFTVPAPKFFKVEKNYFEAGHIMQLDIELPNSSLPSAKIVTRKPWGVCTNTRTEEIWIPDRERHEIMVYSPDGTLKSKIGQSNGQPSSADGHFFRPVAVAYDEVYNRIYVSDKDNHRVQILDGSGKFLGKFGRKGKYRGQLNFPWGIAVSPNGEYIAVADSRNHRIQIFNKQGHYCRQYIGDPNTFVYPRGVAFDPAGKALYITDFKLHRVCQLDLKYHTCNIVYWNLNRPSGIAIDQAGNLLVCDSRHSALKIIPKEGNCRQGVREVRMIGKNRIEHPLDVVVMKGGYIALLDLNGRVTVF